MAIYWSSLPLEDESIRMAKITNPAYAEALKKNLTPKFADRMKVIANSKQNFILSSFGTQGSGKSYQMLFLYEKFNAYKKMKINLDNCTFVINDLLDVVAKLAKGETFILDEQVHTSGYGSNIERMILENIEMTVRQDRLSFFFLAPKYIGHNFHYFLETWQMGSDQPWDFNKSIYDQWKYTRSILFDHRQHMLGYIVTGKPTDEDFLVKYEKKKNQYISKFRQRKGSGRYKHILDRAYKIMADDEFLTKYALAKNKTMKRLLVIIKLEGELISIDELRMLIDYCDFIANFEPSVKEKLRQFASNKFEIKLEDV